MIYAKVTATLHERNEKSLFMIFHGKKLIIKVKIKEVHKNVIHRINLRRICMSFFILEMTNYVE